MTSGHPALSISIASSSDEPPSAPLSAQLERLQDAIDHAAHLLPSQGPITVFVHHNTLHALEDLPFSQAVAEGSRTFGCEPFYSKEYYRKQLKSGRIRISDLEAVLRQDLEDRGSEHLDTLGTRFDLYLAMVRFPLQMAPTPELEWMIAETDALRRFRRDVTPAIRGQMVEDTRHWVMRNLLKSSPQAGAAPSGNGKDQGQLQSFIRQLSAEFGGQPAELWNNDQWEAFCLTALWNICLRGMEGFPPQVPRHTQPLVRHRDWLFKVTGKDSDLRVNDILIRFTAAFLDQGLAHWELPHRELGLYQAFLRLFSTSGLAPDADLRGLRGELQRLLRNEVSPLECIQQTLRDLGVGPDELDEYLLQTLLTLRGWAGMIWQIETRTDRVVRPAPQGTLVEFLAVRLLLERTVIGNMARDELGWQGPLSAFRGDAAKVSSQPREEELDELEDLDQRAFYVFQLAQVMGWSPRTLYELPRSSWGTLLEELHSFNNFERRRIWQLAYERRYRTEALDALSLHAARDHFPRTPVRAQVVCCIDDREESFRRHLEEVAPDIETLSAAGFFAVAMYYQGAADAHYTPLCPIIVRPQHWVAEDVVFSLETSHQMRRRARRAVGRATHQVHLGSRSFAIGAVLATILGPLASVPMVARILFPRHTARLREAAEQLVEVPRVTQLRLERSRPDPSQEEGHIGYTVPEMTNIVERLLRDLGLTSNFAPLVLIVGHGSSSLNNPHESAYNCGACAGSRGGPNARAFAQMANDARVRGRLRERGLEIPPETVFVGSFHNTCDDDVEYFDLDRLPSSHREQFLELRKTINEARQRNALERCRRFESAPLDLTPEQALLHVEARAEDLAQARPEYNHATNAICFVGRRQRTRSLFMDRRAFLNSYDPTQDDAEQTILTRILSAAVPVCAGISLEYYFSAVDPYGWGCGNKLPHNVASLLGVMEGALSDLRPGLSSQMTEIHEAMRLLFIIETTPEAMFQIMARNDAIRQHIENDWVQLALLDPHSSQIRVYHDGKFEAYTPECHELPRAATSYEWYRGWRDHLGFAVIQASEPGSRIVPADRQEEHRS